MIWTPLQPPDTVGTFISLAAVAQLNVRRTFCPIQQLAVGTQKPTISPAENGDKHLDVQGGDRQQYDNHHKHLP